MWLLHCWLTYQEDKDNMINGVVAPQSIRVNIVMVQWLNSRHKDEGCLRYTALCNSLAESDNFFVLSVKGQRQGF